MAARIDNGEDDGVELHEINVTPFIDVMLVLLIIFMVAAPLSTVDVAVDLPVSTAKPQPRPDKPLFVTIKADCRWRSAMTRSRGAAGQAIDAATETDRQKRIFLRADKTVPYGELMIVMNLLRAAAISSWRWSAWRAQARIACAPCRAAPGAVATRLPPTVEPTRAMMFSATFFEPPRTRGLRWAGAAAFVVARMSAAPPWRSCTGRRTHRMTPRRQP